MSQTQTHTAEAGDVTTLREAQKKFERIGSVGGGIFSAEGHVRCQDLAVEGFDAIAAALAAAAQVNPGREEIARIIAKELGQVWESLRSIGFGKDFTQDDFYRAADAILAARPVAEGDAGGDA